MDPLRVLFLVLCVRKGDGASGHPAGELLAWPGCRSCFRPSSCRSIGGRLPSTPARSLGPGASLRCGLSALDDDVTHAVIVLADGPGLDPRAVARVLEHRAEADVVAASYEGARSHPVVLARSIWGSVPDEGARAFDPTLIDCSDLEPPGDVDFSTGEF